jgi:glycosyltransferase involved in cell wall biosynthesis
MTTNDVSKRALVIVPTYNEAENIERLVGEILAQTAPIDVVVVDDNSPDGTGELADALASQHPRVSVIHRADKLGLGTAYIAGFRRALELGYGYAITMDADFSHNPRYLPGLLALMAQHDLGIGSRYVPGGGATGCTWSRILLSKVANGLAKGALGLKAHDCTAGFRCYKAEVLRAIELDTIFSSGYSFLVEMVTRCERRGFSVGELPIVFDNRRLGASKISRKEIYKSVYTVFRLRFSRLPWERLVALYRRGRGSSEAK